MMKIRNRITGEIRDLLTKEHPVTLRGVVPPRLRKTTHGQLLRAGLWKGPIAVHVESVWLSQPANSTHVTEIPPECRWEWEAYPELPRAAEPPGSPFGRRAHCIGGAPA